VLGLLGGSGSGLRADRVVLGEEVGGGQQQG